MVTCLRRRRRFAAPWCNSLFLRLISLAWIAWCAACTAVRAASIELPPRWIAGGAGGGVGEFGVPESVAFDAEGRVVVTDKGRMMLHVYASEDGRALFDVGHIGSTLGSFDRPNGIAVDRAGQILVVEQLNRRVQVFAPDYRPLRSFGVYGTGLGGFQKPMGIALGPDGLIYVTDEARADVQVFDPNGVPLWLFAKIPHLQMVESIEIDAPRQRIFVCDEGKSCVNLYDMQGSFTGSFGSQGIGPGQFGNDPNAIRIDAAGRIYVNDQGNSRINVYSPETRFLASFVSTAGAMSSADGMALSETLDLLLVADQGNNRVLAFPLGEMQCRLSLLEIKSPAGPFAPFTVSVAGQPFVPGSMPLWGDALVRFETRSMSASDPKRIETSILHLRSHSDRGGICIPLVETGFATNVFKAEVQLADTSDEAQAQLATFEEDELRAHVGGEADAVILPIAPLPAPLSQTLRVGLRAEGRVIIDTPSFSWRFADPSGRRIQTAYRARVLREDGSIWWQTGEIRGDASEAVYSGPPLPHGEALRLGLRVAAGRSWSEWCEVPMRRNTPPMGARTVAPRNGQRVLRWPLELTALVATDPDGDVLRTAIEIGLAAGPRVSIPMQETLDDMVRFNPKSVTLGENDRLLWRVVTSDGYETACTEWSSVLRNDIEEPPIASRPVYPLQGATVPFGPLRFRWTAATDPDPESVLQYAVQCAGDPSFTNARTAAAGTACELEWKIPLPAHQFFWRVRVTDPTGRRAWSAPQEIRVRRAPTLSPAGEAEPGPRTGEPVAPRRTHAGNERGMTGLQPLEVPSSDVPAPLRLGTRLQMARPGSPARIELYDVGGRRVRRALAASDGSWTWDARDDAGRRLAPGVYFLHLRDGAEALRRKVVWLGD